MNSQRSISLKPFVGKRATITFNDGGSIEGIIESTHEEAEEQEFVYSFYSSGDPTRRETALAKIDEVASIRLAS